MLDLLRRPLRLALDLRRANAALSYASRVGGSGVAFGRYGRRLGARLLARGVRMGTSYVLAPVSIVRYFELPFVVDALPVGDLTLLDVSSPRILGLYIAEHRPGARLKLQNPHAPDIEATARIAAKLGILNLESANEGVETLAGQRDRWDCVTSVSVVEHIDDVGGGIDDSAAMKLMFDAVRPGGRLLVTVPVDRTFDEEFRPQDTYGTSARVDADGNVFFQRWYDEAALRERLLAPLGVEPTRLRWFGEREAGRLRAYEDRWRREGREATLDDPREIADHYSEYPEFGAMPGAGVCGIVVDKPR